MNKRFILLLLISVLPIANATKLTKLDEKQNNIFSFKRISQVLASPDGQKIAINVFQSKSDDSGNKWVYSLHIKDQTGNIHISNKNDSVSSLNWSPDGKSIAYLMKGKVFQSIWIEDVKTHVSKKLIEFKTDIDSFKWSPDGKSIVFIAENSNHKSEKSLTPVDISKNYSNSRLFWFTLGKMASIEPGVSGSKLQISQVFV